MTAGSLNIEEDGKLLHPRQQLLDNRTATKRGPLPRRQGAALLLRANASISTTGYPFGNADREPSKIDFECFAPGRRCPAGTGCGLGRAYRLRAAGAAGYKTKALVPLGIPPVAVARRLSTAVAVVAAALITGLERDAGVIARVWRQEMWRTVGRSAGPSPANWRTSNARSRRVASIPLAYATIAKLNSC